MARSKIEHRRSGERNRVRGDNASIFAVSKGARFSCEARRNLTWC
jgi:hypothetical protein